MASDQRVCLITDERAFQELKGAWNRLVEALDSHSVFHRHEWFDAAWQWCRQSGELFILCVYRGESLIGILPLVREQRSFHHMKTVQLHYLSVPDTQFSDLLVDRDHAADVGRALVEWLGRSTGRWDSLVIDKLPPESSALAEFLDAWQDSPMAAFVACESPNPGISMTVAWDEYYPSRTRRLKTGNNNIRNKLKRNNESVDIEWVNADGGDADAALRMVTDISAQSWKSDTGLTLDNQGPHDFIARLTQSASTNGWLSVWILRLDGTPVAAEYQIIYQGRVYALRADYIASFRDQSPGSYLNWQLLERLFESDLEYYSMGPGENPYKDRWATQYEPLNSLEIYSRSVRGRMMQVTDRTWRPAAKALLARIRPDKTRASDA